MNQRVAFFMPSLEGGGAERVVITLANEFAKAGYITDLVVASGEGPYRSIVSDEVNIVDFGKSRVLKALLPLVKYLKKNRPTALLGVMTHCNMVALFAKMIARVPTRVIGSEHNSLRNRAEPTWSKTMKRWIYPRSQGVVAVSQGIKKELEKNYGLPSGLIHTIYNPLNVKEIVRMSNEPVHHAWFDGDAKTLIAVGSLTDQKDYATLLRALAQASQVRDVRLFILGKGPLREELENLATELGLKERVEFLGFRDNPFAWLRRSDLYVMSSRWEGLPGALLEALACGTPVVSTNCPTGPDEILEGGRWGRLVPVAAPLDLATAILEGLEESPEIDVRKRVLDFDKSVAVTKYERLLLGGSTV